MPSRYILFSRRRRGRRERSHNFLAMPPALYFFSSARCRSPFHTLFLPRVSVCPYVCVHANSWEEWCMRSSDFAACRSGKIKGARERRRSRKKAAEVCVRVCACVGWRKWAGRVCAFSSSGIYWHILAESVRFKAKLYSLCFVRARARVCVFCCRKRCLKKN